MDNEEKKKHRAELWRKWSAANPPDDERRRRKAAQQRAWRAANPELAKRKAKERYQRDPKAAYEKQKAWRLAHPEQWARLARSNMLQRKYGIPMEQYDLLFEAQAGKCAICGTSDPGTKPGKIGSYFPVDHDHETGAVRGLLCMSCNTGLGLFKDSPVRLQQAIHYITK